jgi:RNA polymerase sigma factor (sigma-70 family)
MTPPAEYVADAYVRFRARVEAAAARILRDREEAADIASEAFLAMLERGPDSQAATLAWLLSSARNRALNRVRDRTREARRAVAAAPREAEPEITAAIAPVGLVAGAAERLCERDRRALELRFVEERAYEDVAAALSTTASQARVVVHRAARRLRRETVRLLAEHHGASASCRRAIVTGAMNGGIKPHAGCTACTSVADEVAALAARGLLPITPAALSSLDRWIGSVSPVHAPRLAEALTALFVAGATALLPPAPVPAAMASSPAGPVAGPNHVLVQRIASGASAASAPALAALRTATPGLVLQDPSGDDASPFDAPARMLRLPLAIRDPLHDASSDGGRDVRRFEVGVTRDRSALVFRFLLGGRPAPASVYAASWRMNDECTGSTEAQTADQGATALRTASSAFTVSCVTPQGLLMSSSEVFDAPASASYGRYFIDITVAFRDMKGKLATLFRPGAVMHGVSGSTSEVVGGVWVGRDQVPDDGNAPDYVIPS